MDELENKTSGAPSDIFELQEQCESLRHLLISVLVLIVIISGTLNIFFLRQFRSTHADVKALRPVVENYHLNTSALTNFAAQLVEFEKKNPDFSPIVTKYGLRHPPVTNTPPPAITPPPLAPAKK
jgi:hypothetical protein